MNLGFLFLHTLILVRILLRSNLSSLHEAFLILNVLQKSAFHYFFNWFSHYVCFIEKSAIFFSWKSAKCVHYKKKNKNIIHISILIHIMICKCIIQGRRLSFFVFILLMYTFRGFSWKKTRGFIYKTRIMAELIEKVRKGGFLKYIKYKKYFMQRAKIQAEKDSDQY